MPLSSVLEQQAMPLAIEDNQMDELCEALGSCSSETVRLVQPLLFLPAVQHMLLVFLSDQSRSFEDWIMEPQCRHRLSQLRDRIDSQDVPALTAKYEEQLAAATQERLRISKTLPRTFPLPVNNTPMTEVVTSNATVVGATQATATNGLSKENMITTTSTTITSTRNGLLSNGNMRGKIEKEFSEAPAANFSCACSPPVATTTTTNSGLTNASIAVASETAIIGDDVRGDNADGPPPNRNFVTNETPVVATSREDENRVEAMVVGGGVDVTDTATAAAAEAAAEAAEAATSSDGCPLPMLSTTVRGGELEVDKEPKERGREGSGEEEVDDEDLVLEDACEMLVVISEAMKEEARKKFRCGDFMGAAKTYRRAAESLDERTPPSSACAEPLRKRIRELYVTCMCNAAVAGFKAAAAAPAPGEAHRLVVDVCTRALERSGGNCPKGSFWRARVKLCQHMYEAAEMDLRKAVEDEEKLGEISNASDTNTADYKRTGVNDGAGALGETSGNIVNEKQATCYSNVSGGHVEPKKMVSIDCDDGAGEMIMVSDRGREVDVDAIEKAARRGVDARAVVVTNAADGEDQHVHKKAPDGDDRENSNRSNNNEKKNSKSDSINSSTSTKSNTNNSNSSTVNNSYGSDARANPVTVIKSVGDNDSDSESSSNNKNERGIQGGQHQANGGDKDQLAIPSTTTPPPPPSQTTTASPPGTTALSEAARWLARVRAKIAQMDQARSLAASQASQRAGRASEMQEKAAHRAQIRARHGPGHILPQPTHPPPAGSDAMEEVEAIRVREKEGGNGGGGEASADPGSGKGENGGEGTRGGGGGGREEIGGVGGKREVIVWRVPKPPKLHNPKRTPAMVMNDYAMRARFQALPEYEQVTGDDGQPEYICTYSVGPNDRLVGTGRGTNMKTAKQHASKDLVTVAAIAWNEENPDDLIDMADMVPLPPPEKKKREKFEEEEITEEFKGYVTAWVGRVAANEIQEARFPIDIAKHQRKYVHRYVEEREDHSVLSKSCTVKGRRRLSVMRRAMMEGLAYLSGGNVIVVDIPVPPTLPSEVPDLGLLTRPPPEPVLPPKKSHDATADQVENTQEFPTSND